MRTTEVWLVIYAYESHHRDKKICIKRHFALSLLLFKMRYQLFI